MWGFSKAALSGVQPPSSGFRTAVKRYVVVLPFRRPREEQKFKIKNPLSSNLCADMLTEQPGIRNLFFSSLSSKSLAALIRVCSA